MLLKKQEISIFDVCSSSVPAMSYYLLRFLILRTFLLPIALCVRFVVLRDAETRRYKWGTVRCWICPAIKKRRREPGRDGISLVKQDAAHKGFCWTLPLYRPLRSLEQFQTQGFLRIESTAVQRCARKSTEFAAGSNIVGESRGRWNIP